MLDALADPHRWTTLSWSSSILSTSADSPAEVLARLAAHHGEIVIETLSAAPLLGPHAARRAATAWRFARMAVVVDALASDSVVVFAYDRFDQDPSDDLVAVYRSANAIVVT